MNSGRYSKILKNQLYKDTVSEIAEAEKERIFCKHDIDHFVDVARIATIMAADNASDLDRDLIYAAALTHDLGRSAQYGEGIPHEIAGGEIAAQILKECGYDDNEVDIIQKAIMQHRNGNNPAQTSGSDELAYLLQKADKMSRKCFACEAKEQCNWKVLNEDLII